MKSQAQKLGKLGTFLLFTATLLLSACDSVTESDSREDSRVSDEQIRTQIQSAIASTSDLPQELVVVVNQGMVMVSGSLDCEECGGLRTPGTLGTVQQSLGAIVRAVSGVNSVTFELTSDL